MRFLLLAALLSLGFCLLLQAEPDDKKFVIEDKQYHFVFFAALEGAYEEGLSKEDVAVLLSRSEEGRYNLFIVACPLCTPVQEALKAYAQRPITRNKRGEIQMLGPGLDPNIRRLLQSEKLEDHLTVLNGLVAKWIEKRIADQKITGEALAALEKDLQKLRDEGMRMLSHFRKQGAVAVFAPAFMDVEECAVCNAAVGKPMPMAKPATLSAPATEATAP